MQYTQSQMDKIRFNHGKLSRLMLLSAKPTVTFVGRELNVVQAQTVLQYYEATLNYGSYTNARLDKPNDVIVKSVLAKTGIKIQ